jgi:hypothetical protein
MTTTRKNKIINKTDKFQRLAKKYGVRYRGQTKREIADSLVAFRQQFMNVKEKEMIYPFATENKNKKLLRKTMKRK